MNERIRLLAEQADEYAEQTVHYYMGQFDGLTWEGKIKQTRDTKFAELIVRECCLVLEQTQTALDRHKWPTPSECGIYIKEHFGVEE